MRSLLRLPAVCRLCNQYHRDEHAICQLCVELFEPLGSACQICAIPLPDQNPLICGACAVNQPYLDRVITHFRFSEPLRTVLHAFKYESALYFRSLLSDLMLQTSVELATECLIPVPMHKNRLQKRGFNQAAILSQDLSRTLKIPHTLSHCTKIIPTLPQAGLSAIERHANLKNAFQTSTLPYQHVTLIDDIYTTGATANELAKQLKRQGVAKVNLWCCARTVIQPKR
ncbi:MAG: ComF family protein [Gammaproteobacteria bacterium]|nr:ComF family protein [Gammaproteobacteria bacterium]